VSYLTTFLIVAVVTVGGIAAIALGVTGAQRLWAERAYRRHYGVASGRRFYGLGEP
jgi:hypothetical protein